MVYTNKSIKLVDDVWTFLENNFKGSEITFELIIREIDKRADTNNTLRQAIKYLWDNYDWFDYNYKAYCIDYIKNNYGIRLK